MSAISSSSTAQSLGLQIKNSKNKKAKRATRFWNENTVIERHKYQTISYTLSNIKKYSFFQKVYKEAILKLQRIQSQFESYETKIFLNIPTFSLSPTQKLNYIWKSNSPSRKQMNLNKKNKSQHGGYLLILQYQREEEVFIDQYNTSNPSSLIRSQDNHLKNDDIILDQAKDSYNSLLCKINYNSQEKNNIKITNITKRQNTFCYIFQIKKWILLDQKVCAMLIQYQIKRNFLTFSTFSQKDIQKIQSTPQQQDMKISQQEYFNFNANIINMIEKGVKIFKKERINTNLKEEEKKVSYSYQSNLNLLQQLNQQQLQNYKKNSQTYEISTNLKIKPQNSHTLATLFTKIPNLQNDSKEERNYKQNGMFQAEMIQIKSGIQQKQKTNIHQEYLKIISSVIDDAQIGDYNIKFTSKDDIHSKLSQIKRQNVLNLLRRYKKEDQKKLQSKYLLSKSSISLNNHGYQKYQKKNNKSFTSCGRLLGGGSGMSIGCCSNQNIINQDQIANDIDLIDDVQVIKDSKVDEKFIKNYNKYIVSTQRKKKEVINKSLQSVEIINILNNCLDKFKDQIPPNLQSYRLYVFEIFDLILQYSFSLSNYEQNDEDNICDQIDLILEKLKKCTELHPCQDITFMLQFLYDMNFSKFRNTEAEVNHRQAIENLSQLLISNQLNIGSVTDSQKSFSKILQEGREHIKQIKLRAASKEKLTDGNIWRVVDDIHQQFHSAPKDIIAQQMSYVWSLRIEYLEELEKKGKENIQVEDEILFYINQFMELSQRDTTYSQILLYVITTIHYLFEKKGLTNYFSTEAAKSLAKKLPISNSNIKNFICMLQQNRFSQQQSKNFFKFMVKDKTYRFISNQILLKYLLILSQQQEISDTIKEDFWVHLCYTYVTEKNQSVKTIFQNDSSFIRSINQKKQERGMEYITNKILEKQESRKKEYKQNDLSDEDFQSQVETIKNQQDLIEKISLNLIQRYEQQARQRLDKDKSLKDDILLEVQDLYINQNITYLQGNQIFSQATTNNRDKTIQQQISTYQKSQHYSEKKEEDIQGGKKNSLEEIAENFLNHQRKQEGQNIIAAVEKGVQDDKKQNCCILGILADGGTGKSMAMKKLETIIIEDKNKQQSSSNDKTTIGKYIPFIIKCNGLDPKNPSIEEYLKNQDLSEFEISSIKNSSQHKLIILDGYDEYTGEYFKIYSKLRLSEWQNTKIIVTSRKEKLSESDACIYFSKYDDNGKRDESSYCIVQLQEFERKDVDEYCSRFFKKSRTNNQQLDQNQYDRDISAMEKFLKNSKLENLLLLPINLYLFTRMLVTKEESEVSKLANNISDQIQIQEIFFQEQFIHETKNFIYEVKCQDNKELQLRVASAYFEYFQQIAINMLINKGKSIRNFLQLNKAEINFELQDSLKKILSKKQQNTLKDKIINYVNSKIVTRLKEEEQFQIVDHENQQYQDGKQRNEDTSYIKNFVEFRHKSLFEYFAARAMKFDFEIHQENIYKLPIEQLQRFSINKELIMSPGYNKSEQQILLKLSKLIELDLQSGLVDYTQNYSCNRIEDTNRYIQYIRSARIENSEEISPIDKGASNILSALFVSRFAYDNLTLTQCSLSKAYLINKANKNIVFERCNLSDALLRKIDISSVETSNTLQATFDVYPNVFDTDSIQGFNQIIFSQVDVLMSINELGYVNSYRINKDKKKLTMLKQKKITNTPLKQIVYYGQDNKFVISGNQAIFLIDCNDLKIISTKRFNSKIKNIDCQRKKCLIQLENETSFYGNFDEEGFQEIQLKGTNAKLSPQNCELIITQNEKEMIIYEVKENQFNMINTINTGKICSAAFSVDGKYLATGSDDNNCKIWNVGKGFQLMNTIEGHTGKINSVAFSADGKYLATCSDDKTCKIMNAEKGYELMNTIQEHTGLINSVAFSLDGKYLATGSDDKTCKIWSAEKGFELMNTFEGHTSKINSVAFSAYGKYLATCSDDKTCKIWNAEKGFELMNTIEAHTHQINSVAFSADGKYLATVSSDMTCKIWNAEKKFELMNTIQGHTGKINSVAFSADGKYLATCSDDKTCKIRNAEKEFELISTIEGNTDNISQVAFSANGKYLATFSASPHDYTCKIWNAQKGFELMNKIEGHNNQIRQVAFSADGKYLATVSYDNTCKIWNAEKGFKLMNTIEEQVYFMRSVAFSADGKYLATGWDDSTCKIWNAEKGFELINTIKNHNGAINSIAFSADGKYLATGSDDKTCKVWNAEKGFELTNTIEGHKHWISSVAFSADGKYQATGSYDNTCKIWNAENGFELMNTIEGHTFWINSVAFSADGKYLATGSLDKTCKIWNVQKGFELMNTIEGHIEKINSLSFSADGKYLAIGSDDKTCKIWNSEKGFELMNIIKEHTDKINSVTFSANGKYLATGSDDKTCKIWNAEKGFELINTIEGHSDKINSVAFSADGKYLATCSDDKTCKIWNAEKGFELMNTIEGNTHRINSVAFSADGKYLATSSGTNDFTCKILNAEKEFELIYTIEGHTSWIISVAFSANGKYLATGSFDKTCRIWNAEKAKCH